MDATSVLIVDDNDVFREALEGVLLKEGHLAVAGHAADGAEALEKASALSPEVVLIDLSMPVLSGLEAIPRLRQVVPGARIIVLTVSDEEEYRAAALEAGASAFITKSEVKSKLLPLLQHVCCPVGENEN